MTHRYSPWTKPDEPKRRPRAKENRPRLKSQITKPLPQTIRELKADNRQWLRQRTTGEI